jgi:sortase A
MVFRRYERVLLIPGVVGMALMGVWSAVRTDGVLSARRAVANFRTEQSAKPNGGPESLSVATSASPVDFRLWSLKRISAYQDSLALKKDAPIAILRIPKIQLEVPVFNGTDDLTLNRGVGRVLGTADLGQPGNLGIAGHRDGFFRGLQDIAQRDLIELVLPERRDWYSVEEIRIVSPDDVSVLGQTTEQNLTLITCYPFYFVGHAPKRYVVRATLEHSERAALVRDGDGGSHGSTVKYKEKQK